MEQLNIEDLNTNKKYNVIFISGNLDLNEKQFIKYYINTITELIKDDSNYFNISDDEGCSEMTQILLNKFLTDKSKVNVFCIGDYPKHYISNEFNCFYGFKTLEERNAAMTLSSNMDLHVILSGKGRSMIEDNLCRRNEPEYNYMKHYINGNSRFWQIFFENLNEKKEENYNE